MDEQIEQIAPCPFCAKAVEPEFYDRGERSSYWYVSCNAEEGEHQVRAIGDSRAEAIAAWNTREGMSGTIAELTEARAIDFARQFANITAADLSGRTYAECEIIAAKIRRMSAALAPPRHD